MTTYMLAAHSEKNGQILRDGEQWNQHGALPSIVRRSPQSLFVTWQRWQELSVGIDAGQWMLESKA